MFSVRISLAFLLIVLPIGCGAGQQAPTDTPMTAHVPPAPWSLTYHDGSGNGFRFWQEAEPDAVQFTYTPVTPAMSSSGIYSGGSTQKGTMNDKQVANLWQSVRHLEADSSLHADSRMMGTGTFRLETAAGVQNFMVKRGEALQRFDEIVSPFREE
jgi:hypothetical protein